MRAPLDLAACGINNQDVLGERRYTRRYLKEAEVEARQQAQPATTGLQIPIHRVVTTPWAVCIPGQAQQTADR
jgi:hypothetical protein